MTTIKLSPAQTRFMKHMGECLADYGHARLEWGTAHYGHKHTIKALKNLGLIVLDPTMSGWSQGFGYSSFYVLTPEGEALIKDLFGLVRRVYTGSRA